MYIYNKFYYCVRNHLNQYENNKLFNCSKKNALTCLTPKETFKILKLFNYRSI